MKIAELEENEEVQKGKEQQINEANAKLKKEQENLDEEHMYWEERTQLYEELIEEFKKELEIVIQAENIIKSASQKE